MDLINYVERVPGSDVAVCLGVLQGSTVWNYTLWSDDGAGDLIASGSVDMTTLDVTPSQVARIAFLLKVDYSEV